MKYLFFLLFILFQTLNANEDAKAFQKAIISGIPENIPDLKPYEIEINHAPKRKHNLSLEEKNHVSIDTYFLHTETLYLPLNLVDHIYG